MGRIGVPGWFSKFVRSVTCWQDNSQLLRPMFKLVGEDYLALARCRQNHHVYVVIGFAKLPPEIAGDPSAEAQEAAKFWMKHYPSYGFSCAKCKQIKFDSFSFDQVEQGKANVYQVCSRCRETQLVAIRWIYHEEPTPISTDEVLDVYDLLEGKGKKKVKTIRQLERLLEQKEKTKT